MTAYVSPNDLSVFCRWFSTLLSVGLSPAQCLDVLSQQQRSLKLKRVLADLQRSIEAGSTLSKSMARHPKVFSPLCVGLVCAGEIGGVLEETLGRFAEFLEKDVEMKRQARLAATCTTLIAVAALLIVIGLGRFIFHPFSD